MIGQPSFKEPPQRQELSCGPSDDGIGRDVFINAASAFLPNDPVDNDQIESILGCGSAASRRLKNRMLRVNGIRTRYYVLDKDTGEPRYTNYQLAAEAVRGLLKIVDQGSEPIECLVCATSCADQLIPSHASMTHGELGLRSCEVASFSGVCCSGVAALKYGYMNVRSGFTSNAVATASEATSLVLRQSWFAAADEGLEFDHGVGFDLNAEILRWMLSDGAGALFLSNRPRDDGISLKIDWIEIVSMADQSAPAMYLGAEKTEDGRLVGWGTFPSPVEPVRRNFITIKQDSRLLSENISRLGGECFAAIAQRRNLDRKSLTYFLPHYSSEYFRPIMEKTLEKYGVEIDKDKWFTNLHTRGNTGSASIYIMLEELINTKPLQSGQKILCFVPEGARFTYALFHLTVQ